MSEVTAAEVLAVIRKIAEAELDVVLIAGEPVQESHQLTRDLEVDSLGATILAVGLEDHFRVKLDEQDAAALVTVGDLVALVRRRLAERGDAPRT